MNAKEKYQEFYCREPKAAAFCPYRVCPVGAHIDHQRGKVTGFALDRGIHIAYSPQNDDTIELQSLNFSDIVQFRISEIPKQKVNDWADHLRGAALVLNKRHPLKRGLTGVIEGTLPTGGISSSAAVILAFLQALCRVNKLTLPPSEMIELAQAAENQYVGVNCGTLDQSCEVLCKKDNLLYLDTKDGSYQLLPKPGNMPAFKIAIFFSGLDRALTGTQYNMRVDECRSAGYALLAYAGLPYGKLAETNLRDIPQEVFEAYKERLPLPWRLRAEHCFGEMARVERAIAAWQRGDIEEFGRISFESGRSTIDYWETGCEQMKTIYDIMVKTDGILGGRFSGAGFKGCCMAIIRPDAAEAITEKLTREYLAAWPELKGKFSVHICDTASGLAYQQEDCK